MDGGILTLSLALPSRAIISLPALARTTLHEVLTLGDATTMAPWVRFSLALLSCGLAALLAWALAESRSPTRPNILFILTDDQDVHMDSLSYMPFLQRHLVAEGLSFRKHFCTVALCCPARGVLWSGQSAHNTNVRVP